MRVTVNNLRDKKRKGEKIAMLTAYDYSTAKILDESGVDMLLVGDSLAMVMLGHSSTLPVTMDEMLHHSAAVVRGASHALVVGDMPFMSYQISMEDALRNAGRFLKEAGVQAVKLEGGEEVAPLVARLVQSGIPVMGHIGLQPQSVNQLGGYRVQGRTLDGARKLLADAKALEEAGAFSIVLECVPAELAKLVTENVSVPTIGIGAGAGCDGQVQVINDLLGMFTDFVPKHAKVYAQVGQVIREAVAEYIDDVRTQRFPTLANCVSLDPAVAEKLEGELGQVELVSA